MTAPTFEFMWSNSAEEGREKGLLRYAFNTTREELPYVSETIPDTVAVTEAAVKVG